MQHPGQAGAGHGARKSDLLGSSSAAHIPQPGPCWQRLQREPRLQRAIEHLHLCGPTSVGEFIVEILDHLGAPASELSDAEREWSLAGVPKAQRQKGSGSQAPVWRCECGCLNPTAVFVCLACDQQRPGRRQVESVPGNLAELTADRLDRARRLTYPQMMRARLSEAELREFARARGYKQGWVFHRLREQVAQSAGAAA